MNTTFLGALKLDYHALLNLLLVLQLEILEQKGKKRASPLVCFRIRYRGEVGGQAKILRGEEGNMGNKII